jgi:hypothetical protein
LEEEGEEEEAKDAQLTYTINLFRTNSLMPVVRGPAPRPSPRPSPRPAAPVAAGVVGKGSFNVRSNGYSIPATNVTWNGNSFRGTGSINGISFTATGTANGSQLTGPKVLPHHPCRILRPLDSCLPLRSFARAFLTYRQAKLAAAESACPSLAAHSKSYHAHSSEKLVFDHQRRCRQSASHSALYARQGSRLHDTHKWRCCSNAVTLHKTAVSTTA